MSSSWLAEIAVRKAWHEDQVARHDELRADAELTRNECNRALAELRDIEVATQQAKARAAEDEVKIL
ncbi:hypothetical protein VNO80_23733 [Phaseolus coccineus]|uniref:Uncharacterized protein n=1 Tax=Phaseolus coccineus TaxID=3886 RepID=A0AAN9M739_PHACN